MYSTNFVTRTSYSLKFQTITLAACVCGNNRTISRKAIEDRALRGIRDRLIDGDPLRDIAIFERYWTSMLIVMRGSRIIRERTF